MSNSSLIDAAWGVRALVRHSDARLRFLTMCRSYLETRRHASGRPVPKDLLENDGELTLVEKYAMLAALHDEVCTSEAKIGSEILSPDDPNEGIRWECLAVTTVRQWLQPSFANDFTQHVQSWLDDVRADISQSSEAESTRNGSIATTPEGEVADFPKERDGTDGRTSLDEWTWIPDGNGYLVAGLGERGHLAGLKGLPMIEKLVRSPGRPVPMIELFGGVAGQPSTDQRSKQPAMDEDALAAVYKKYKELQTEIQKAESEGRTLEAAESREELEKLQEVLNGAIGIRGSARDLNYIANTLRPSIHTRLSRVYDAMRDANPPMPKLADHLRGAIGAESAAFVYRPGLASTPAWKTEK